MADPRPLSRDQLAKFLPDAKAVKRFERLFAVAGDLTPTDVSTLYRLTQEASIVADSSMAGVASALAQILELAQRSAINESTADSKATAALALASQLARQLEAALVAPPPAEPYLERMHDVRMLSPQDGDFIQYNSTSHQWENRPIGTAAYADLQTSATDATAGRVLSVGAFGLGGSVSLGLFDLNSAQVGSFIGVDGTEANAATYNWPVTGAAGTTPVWYSVLTYGTTSRATQRATWIFAGANQGRIFERVKHDATWSSWRECPRLDASAGLTVSGILTAVGGLKTGLATALVTSTVTMNNGAAAATATLSNAPLAGNPTKWIPINDNGTTRYIPAW